MVNDFRDMCGALLAIKRIAEARILPGRLADDIVVQNPPNAKFRFSLHSRREFARIGYRLFSDFLDAVYEFRQGCFKNRAVMLALANLELPLVCGHSLEHCL